MLRLMANGLGLAVVLILSWSTPAWSGDESEVEKPPVADGPLEAERKGDSDAQPSEQPDAPRAPHAPRPPEPPSPQGPPEHRRDRPPASTLERAIADALAHNPEIRLAEIKVREAEAEAARVRLEITKHVVGALHEIEQTRSELDRVRERVRQRKGFDRFLPKSPQAKRIEEEARHDPDLRKAESKLREVEAKFLPLLGHSDITLEPVTRVYPLFSAPGPDLLELLSAAFPDIERHGRWELYEPNNSLVVTAPVSVHERLARLLIVLRTKRFLRDGTEDDPPDLIRRSPRDGGDDKKVSAAMKQKVTLEFDQTPLSVVIEFLRDRSGLNFLIAPTLDPKTPITVNVREVTLAGALQAIEDVSTIHWMIRDYGVLATDRPPPSPGFGPLPEPFDQALPPPPGPPGDRHPIRIRIPSMRLPPRPPRPPQPPDAPDSPLAEPAREVPRADPEKKD